MSNSFLNAYSLLVSEAPRFSKRIIFSAREDSGDTFLD